MDDGLPIDPRRRHWQRNRRLTALSLAVWFGASFGGVWFARELNAVFFGWPFSFWVAAQGALLLYALLVWVHTWAMQRIDRAHGPAGDA